MRTHRCATYARVRTFPSATSSDRADIAARRIEGTTRGEGPMSEIRPFRIDVPERDIEELRRRIEATRWPSRELAADRSQGVQRAVLQELARFWTSDYDWRTCEARLNALPQ